MKLVLSLLARALWLGVVGLFGAVLAIAVGMGFDAGMHPFALGIAAVYLFTFLPALVVGFLPWSRLKKPGWMLKIWYGWMALLFGAYVVMRGYRGLRSTVWQASARYETWAHPERFTQVCWRGEGMQPGDNMYFGLGTVRGASGVRAQPQLQCRTRRMDEGPVQALFMSNYGGGMHAVLDVPLVAGGRTCFVMFYDGTMRTQYDKGLGARLETCPPEVE